MTHIFHTITKTKLLIVSLISINVFSMSFCIEKTHSLFSVKNDLKQILLEDEGVILDTQTNCIEIAARPYRQGLVSKFIRMSYPIVSSKDGNIVYQGQMCHFYLRKDELSSEKENSLKIANRFRYENFDSSKKAIQTRQIVVSEGRVGLLELDGTSMYVKCSIFADRIEVELSLNSKFDQSLSTTVIVKEDEWFNVSSVNEELNKKNQNISSTSGLNVTNKEGEKKITFSLSVKK